MPQLDFTIIFPQIFWLLLSFLFTYTTVTYFFLPNFIKSIKSKRLVIIENTSRLLHTEKTLSLKQIQLNILLNKNFNLIKIVLEKEIVNFLIRDLQFNLSSVDKKIINILYSTIVYCGRNTLVSISLNPKFSNLNFDR